MLEMKVLLIVSLYLFSVNCVVLRLPLLNEDSEDFIVKNKSLLGDCNLISYESKDENDFIDKVYYHDVEIYPAESSIPGVAYNQQFADLFDQIFSRNPPGDENELSEEQRDDILIEPEHYRKFRRLVVVAKVRIIMFISVVSVKWEGQRTIKKVDRLYEYDDEVVDFIMENQDHYMRIKYEENVSNSAKIIRNILTREPAKVKSYGDLDEVDDEPFLLKGKYINEEQIRKEVDEILKNPDIGKPQTKDTDTNKADISEADLREAGPSGLSSMLRRKLKLNEISEDSDSD
ncbi:hypothetical protein TpMuguga_03g00635 [Theileria parva strain Muguga]|uniref:Uncharacterized protein n=1 Tax=Theileria parva TaxID=5875 RepID=Q4MZ56_THEPA|nr:uncharacterized protein TpMuguga_03g00635 [Theileria parva strain Muguga]EAN30476.1 hypothetical protein TpMuguga_03g00635 [Theileria parva strain Muguga]|eukprot:XP_762759.1 hypothetical protein [Theileria parva strain Muguga]